MFKERRTKPAEVFDHTNEMGVVGTGGEIRALCIFRPFLGSPDNSVR